MRQPVTCDPPSQGGNNTGFRRTGETSLNPKSPDIESATELPGSRPTGLKLEPERNRATAASVSEPSSHQRAEGVQAAACSVTGGTPPKQTAALIGRRMEIPCLIKGRRCQVLFDTGAQVSLVSEAWLRKNLYSYEIRPVSELLDQRLVVCGVGSEIPYTGYAVLPFQLGHVGKEQAIDVPFLVNKDSMKSPIIGTNVMEEFMAGEISKEGKLNKLSQLGLQSSEILAVDILLNHLCDETPLATVHTLTKKEQSLPANSCSTVECKIAAVMAERETAVLFEPRADWSLENPNIILHGTIIHLKEGKNMRINLNVTNKTGKIVYLDAGQLLGTLEELEAVIPAGMVVCDDQHLSNESTTTVIGEEPEAAATASAHSALVTQVGVDLQAGGDSDSAVLTVQSEIAPEPGLVAEEDQPKSFMQLQSDEVDSKNMQFFKTVSELKLPELKQEEEAMLKNMLWEEKEAFSQGPDDIGCVPDLKLRLRTVDENPVQRHYNAIPKPLYGEVKAHIQNMLEKGWITKSESSWASPIVLAKKKSGGFRVCCDYRQLNGKTLKDKHPLPRIQEALDSLQGSCYFSTLDFSRAYYQGFMEEESREKTAFVTPWGFYQWIRIPFGLSNAVPAFQRFMETLLEDYRDNCAIPYLDDTIVHSRTVTDHILDLRKILTKFKTKGLKLNLAKCELFKQQVSYLGRLVSKDGYQMDEKNVRAVRELTGRSFETIGEIRQLLGLLGFHRRSVQDFAPIARPLTDLLGGTTRGDKAKADKKPISSKQRIEWKTEHQEALEKLILLVTNPPLLAYPDYSQPFFIHTDASKEGLGSILYQKQDGMTRVIAYGSRTLRKSEQNYHSSKLELLAIKWAITEHFRDILNYTNDFKVYTDNNPLLYIMERPKTNAATQRWVSELAEFSFTIHYRPGVVNRDADCLSRLPLDIEKYEGLCKESISLDTFQQMVACIAASVIESDETISHLDPLVEEVIVNAVMTEKLEVWDLKSDQESDDDIKQVIEVLNGQGVARSKLREDSKLLLRERAKLYFDDEGVLRRKYNGTGQIILPKKHRERVYQMLHCDMGHMGAERVRQLARQRVYWPKMAADIEEYTQKRCRCLAQRATRQQPVAPLVSIHSTSPMELIAIDFLHLDRASSGHEYILLVVDHFTRFVQAYPTKNKSAATAAKHLYNDYIPRFGLPGRVMHDQGKEFENKLFACLEKYCGVIRSRTTPYHPQGNGGVERMNATILQMLRTLPEVQKLRWPEKVNKLVFAYNATQHSATGFSPHFLLFGREPILPLDWTLGDRLPKDAGMTKTYNKFAHEWEEQMTEAYKIAKRNSEKAKNYNEERWKRRLIATQLQPGDKVLVKNKREVGGPGKLRSRWEQDVYVVLERKPNGVVYAVRKLAKQDGEKRLLHRNLLLPCDLMDTAVPEVEKQPSPRRPTTRRASPRQGHQDTAEDADTESNSDEEDLQWCIQQLPQDDQNPQSDLIEENDGQTNSADEDAPDVSNDTGTNGAMYPFEDLVNEYFEDTDEDAETFNGFPEEERPTNEDDVMVEDDESDAADSVEGGGNVSEESDACDEAENETVSELESEEGVEDEDSTELGAESTLSSKRKSKPPCKLTYFKLGGDPMVLNDVKTVEVEAVDDNWTLVQAPIQSENEEQARQGDWRRTISSLSRKLFR